MLNFKTKVQQDRLRAIDRQGHVMSTISTLTFGPALSLVRLEDEMAGSKVDSAEQGD